MEKIIFSTYGVSPALHHARNSLESWGYPVTADPAQATHVLLPVPSFDEQGNINRAYISSRIFSEVIQL